MPPSAIRILCLLIVTFYWRGLITCFANLSGVHTFAHTINLWLLYAISCHLLIHFTCCIKRIKFSFFFFFHFPEKFIAFIFAVKLCFFFFFWKIVRPTMSVRGYLYLYIGFCLFSFWYTRHRWRCNAIPICQNQSARQSVQFQ